MGDLFWNKVIGSLLAIVLAILGLQTLSHELVRSETPEIVAYPVDMSALAAANAPAEEEDMGPPDFGMLLASADISAGERVARRCTSCHVFDEGGANGTGPALWDVMGRDVAAVGGFNYSAAMVEYAQGGTEWGYQNMYDYLESPRGYVSGTAMSFAGLRDQTDRINIIAYMRAQADTPFPLPEPAAGEASAPEAAMNPEPVSETDAAVDEAPAEGAEAPAQDTPAEPEGEPL